MIWLDHYHYFKKGRARRLLLAANARGVYEAPRAEPKGDREGASIDGWFSGAITCCPALEPDRLPPQGVEGRTILEGKTI